MKKSLLPELLQTEGIRTRLAQTTGKKRIDGALNTIAGALHRSEDRGFKYANLLIQNFENEFETIGRDWHRLPSWESTFIRLSHKLGIQPEDKSDFGRAVSFLAKQYNEMHKETDTDTAGGYDREVNKADKWWYEYASIRLDDLYTLHKADAHEDDFRDYLKEGIRSRTSQTEARIPSAIDTIAKALAHNEYRYNRIPPSNTNMMGSFEEAFESITDRLVDHGPHKRLLDGYTDAFGVTQEFEDSFKKALFFLVKYYIKVSRQDEYELLTHEQFVEASNIGGDWYSDMVKQLEKKYYAYHDASQSKLSEGIQSRTSQHVQRTKAAIDVIAGALGPDYTTGKVERYDSDLGSLAGFLHDHHPSELEWWFDATFHELDISAKVHDEVKAAMIYIAQRYNAMLESERETHGGEGEPNIWLGDVMKRIRSKSLAYYLGAPKS